VITFDPSRCHPPSNAPHELCGVVLVPGVNDLSAEQFNALADCPLAQTYRDWGALEVAAPPVTVEVAGLQEPVSTPPATVEISGLQEPVATPSAAKTPRKARPAKGA
jgi:hypothetical protein